jgi:5-methylcytosine-specific restriction protein A
MAGHARISKACRHPGCPGRSVPGSAYCAAHRPKARDTYDRGRANAGDRGYDARWRAESAEWLRLHGTCEYCGRPSKCVHHDPPHKGDRLKFWNKSTWHAACVSCNSRIGVEREGGLGNVRT